MNQPTSEEHQMTDNSPARCLEAATPATPASPKPAPLLLTSEDLLRGHQAVAITHNGALYRLQTTRQGKLILTK
jgi:hemin uptake protein HemP